VLPTVETHARFAVYCLVKAIGSDLRRCEDQALTGPLKAGRAALARSETRFLVAGSIASLVNWLARFPLELAMPFAAAVLAAMVVGMVCGFLLYDRWVFPDSTRPLPSKIRDFIAVNVASQAVMFVVSVGARELLLLVDWEPTIAGAVAHLFGIACGALLSYVGHRSITFGARAE
jgi:energy-coupling factor transport system substrate-specific component